MKKILLLLASFFGLVATGVNAQIITTSPSPLQEESADVVLTYHADSELGNMGLKGYTGDVYAHVGAITTKSTSGSDWKYSPSKWGDNSAKYKLTRVATDTYTLTIGDMRTYFGITDATEHVKQIALVFRSADCTKEGKTAAGGDIYVDIHASGFQMQVLHDASSLVISTPTTIKFSVSATRNAELEMKVDGVSKEKVTSTSHVFTQTFSQLGHQYEVEFTGKYDGETISQTFTVYYQQPSPQANYPGGVPKMGPVQNADGSVTFCIAANKKSNVMIVGAWDNYRTSNDNVMSYQDYNGDRYFWITVKNLQKKTDYPYYFLVDGTIKVGDPYARLVLDPYADKWLPSLPEGCPAYPYDVMDDAYLSVYRSNMDDYNWSDATLNFEIPDSRALNIYELLIRDFTGEEGENNGSGTIATMLERLPYLHSLGVNCIELMPVMEFNGNSSWGYNTNFYMALDKAYGSPNELRHFIDACHNRGIAVVLDIVFNQCDGHPWYHMYGGVKNNPYINEVAPHDYSVLNDWKQESNVVKKHFEDVLRYWMTAYKVDGFRFDLVKGLGDNNSYGSGTESYNQSRVDNMKRFHDVIRSVNPRGIHINEFLGDCYEDNARGSDGQLAWVKDDSSAKQYAMAQTSGNALNGFYAPNWGRVVGQTVDFMESHDEERIAYYQKNSLGAHDKRMRRLGSLYAHLLMNPGSKMIWQFGEFGYDESISAHGDRVDPETIRWDYLDDPDRLGLWENIQGMMWLRRDNPELFDGTASLMYNGSSSNFKFAEGNSGTRTIRLSKGNKEVIVFINTSTTVASKTISSYATYISSSNNRLITASHGITTPTISGSGNVSVKLPGHSFAVFASPGVVVGVDDIVSELDGPKANVYGGQGEIVIEGDYDTVEVYNLQGIRFNTLNVPAGMYVVRVDGNATKVVVR